MIVHTSTGHESTPRTMPPDDTVEIDTERLIAAIEEFLADPIGDGQYDFGDPITLDEFETAHHWHGAYAAPLVF